MEHLNFNSYVVSEWTPFYKEADATKQQEIKSNLLQSVFPTYLAKFNKVVQDNGGQYLVCSKPTWADYWLAAFLLLWEETLGSDILKDFPALQTQRNNITSQPQIKEWIEKRPQGRQINGVYI